MISLVADLLMPGPFCARRDGSIFAQHGKLYAFLPVKSQAFIAAGLPGCPNRRFRLPGDAGKKGGIPSGIPPFSLPVKKLTELTSRHP
jgi:hypothetical protein